MGSCSGKACATLRKHAQLALPSQREGEVTTPTLPQIHESCNAQSKRSGKVALLQRDERRDESLEKGKAAFAFGKLVAVDAPRSAGERLQEFKGEQGTVKSIKSSSEGFLYTLRFEAAVPGGPVRELADVPERFLKRAGVLARSANVKPMLLGELLRATSHRIPVFQRRYCWSEAQWRGLWNSIAEVRDDPDANSHSLGRIMLFQHKDGSRLVLDGQQRLTTVLLLLTCLRHRLEALGEEAKDLEKLTASDRFLPTMDDRADFRRCLADADAAGDSSLLCAVRVFSELARNLDAAACRGTADAALGRLSALAFVIDSPEALQSVFEGMARKNQLVEMMKGTEHDLGSCARCFASGEGGRVVPSTHLGPDGDRMCEACAAETPGAKLMTPGMPMVPLDLLRNFVIDHFETENRMVEAHAAHWRPLEVLFGHDGKALEEALIDFLDESDFPVTSRWALYGSFVAWWRSLDGQLTEQGIDARVVAKLRVLHDAMVQRD